MDRCYRIGQSKPVTVIKYSMRPSIEVPMLFLQTTKGALSNCSIKEKGQKMMKLAHGLNRYVYTETLSISAAVNGTVSALRVRLLFIIREKELVDELDKLEGEAWQTLREDA